MATVTLKKLCKIFGKTRVIHGIDIEIKDGEFIVIVGPSGCGKSTLLRMVAGLENVTAGEVLIGGKLANNKEPMDRNIAMVFQNYALYPHMTVAQNMGYGLKIAGMTKSEIVSRVDNAAKLLQLEGMLNRRPKQLSGGQRQRVAMGRAIVRKPAVFLFDEPLSNLDAKLRVQMRLEIKELQSQLGVTALYVTHDQIEAMTMADRMIVMNEGRAEQIGTPLEVYVQPQSLFAAQFIGSPAMNILDASIKDGRVMLGEVPVAHTTVREGPVKLGIRPEHVQLDESGPLVVEVRLFEPLGANTLLHGRLTDGNLAFNISLNGLHQANRGESLMRFAVDTNNCHFFDPKTGHRL